MRVPDNEEMIIMTASNLPLELDNDEYPDDFEEGDSTRHLQWMISRDCPHDHRFLINTPEGKARWQCEDCELLMEFDDTDYDKVFAAPAPTPGGLRDMLRRNRP